jgi:ribulose-phosphate 3-epimerase
MKKILIAPSILSANFGKLNEEIKSVEPYCDLIHVDVMDGCFVPNITLGSVVVARLEHTKPLDVHLMVVNPEKQIKKFAKAGAYMISVHAEASTHLHRTVKSIQELGCKAGVALNPATPICTVEPIIDELDFVLVMTVNPGFPAQRFIGSVLRKVKAIRELRPKLDIEVDGGINTKTIKQAVQAGANILVAGSAIFDQPDRQRAIEELRRKLR